MTPERWEQIGRLFESALGRGPDERAAFLAEACAGDEELRREVEALVASHERGRAFIEEPALEVVARQTASENGAALVGRTIAHYQVLSLVGAGGMGEVYLARDTRLGRKVALKLLPDYLDGDAERTRLFTQEARAASALNHPNIITIHEIGQVGERHYIAMEYVDGETLREKIHREKTPLSKLLGYLQQVAEGLTKAHASGIVHRDLKPDNIMVTRDGYAKVLDFGLAKLVEQPARTDAGVDDSGEMATALLAPHSLPGMVRGTVGYMSPEQAQGRTKEIDHRSDIFSFGCILYEAATGRKPFEGRDLLDALHNIVYAPTPQLKEVNPYAPDDLQRIVRRCLSKDPEKRYHSIKDVAIELEEIQQQLKGQTEQERPASAETGRHISSAGTSELPGASPTALTTSETARPSSSAEDAAGQFKHRRTGVAVIGVILAVGLAVALTIVFLMLRARREREQAAAAPEPLSFQTMKLARLTTTGKASDAAISPDGKYVAYLSVEYGQRTASIWLRQVATGTSVQIVEPGQFLLRGLTFSPDGNYLYYRVADSETMAVLYRVSVIGGGDSRRVTRGVFSPVSFSPDGRRMAFIRNHRPVVGDSNLIVANADGADERIVTKRDRGQLFALPVRPTAPVWSPDGRVLACALGSGSHGAISLLAIDAETGAERPIGDRQWGYIDRFVWRPDGRSLLLTGRDQSSPQAQIWQVAYPSGEARRVTNDLNAYQGMSLTADAGAMVVVQTAREADLWVTPVGKTGEARQVTSGAGKADGNWGVSWTPDGQLVYSSNAGGNRDLWLLDLARGTQKQLTSESRQNIYPQVTPDGRSVVFVSDRGQTHGVWRMDIDGGNPRQLVSTPIAPTFGPPTVSPDGKWVVYCTMGRAGIPALWKVSIDGGEPVQLNQEEQYWTEMPVYSPDGREIACQYFELGKPSSIGRLPAEGGSVTHVAEPGLRIQGTLHWTPDGDAVAYIDDHGSGVSNVWAAPVGGGPPRQLTEFKSEGLFWFDWSRDGRQLAVSRGTQTNDVVLITDLR